MDYRNILFAPSDYWNLTPEAKKEICNGCGAKGWKFDIIPDTIWGLNITLACDIHDYMYYIGTSQEDKDYADILLFINLIKIIDANTDNIFIKILRHNRAYVYYQAVALAGNEAYWEGKDDSRRPCN
jgi:hypothetical protein